MRDARGASRRRSKPAASRRTAPSRSTTTSGEASSPTSRRSRSSASPDGAAGRRSPLRRRLQDGGADPLDRWSRRVVDGAGGRARRARALSVRRSAALAVPALGEARRADACLAARPADPSGRRPVARLSRRARLRRARSRSRRSRAATSPCETCVARPCLSACPVGAFTGAGYDVAACAAHLGRPAGRACMEGGCLARRACPVGAERAQEPREAAFHMRAFLAARGPA